LLDFVCVRQRAEGLLRTVQFLVVQGPEAGLCDTRPAPNHAFLVVIGTYAKNDLSVFGKPERAEVRTASRPEMTPYSLIRKPSGEEMPYQASKDSVSQAAKSDPYVPTTTDDRR
jgi:hypothetical protein